ncbi:hypothetical protein EJ04DRAFT_522943 [Polyplosphaeria fusca]|uniref:Uncharacterized protein n=1 Tax=Polyplosphaeria fusca TaxID=682080 RepID=A0A9P4R1Y1_9PLEO|nr:hypothetical protein EJ04DRAFT_522943 [Polyplosphaeria fusca]
MGTYSTLRAPGYHISAQWLMLGALASRGFSAEPDSFFNQPLNFASSQVSTLLSDIIISATSTTMRSCKGCIGRKLQKIMSKSSAPKSTQRQTTIASPIQSWATSPHRSIPNLLCRPIFPTQTVQTSSTTTNMAKLSHNPSSEATLPHPTVIKNNREEGFGPPTRITTLGPETSRPSLKPSPASATCCPKHKSKAISQLERILTSNRYRQSSPDKVNGTATWQHDIVTVNFNWFILPAITYALITIFVIVTIAMTRSAPSWKSGPLPLLHATSEEGVWAWDERVREEAKRRRMRVILEGLL